MLRIVDYAKRKDVEWYEIIRQAINESSVAPVVILSQGELRVYELDEDEMNCRYYLILLGGIQFNRLCTDS